MINLLFSLLHIEYTVFCIADEYPPYNWIIENSATRKANRKKNCWKCQNELHALKIQYLCYASTFIHVVIDVLANWTFNLT